MILTVEFDYEGNVVEVYPYDTYFMTVDDNFQINNYGWIVEENLFHFKTSFDFNTTHNYIWKNLLREKLNNIYNSPIYVNFMRMKKLERIIENE